MTPEKFFIWNSSAIWNEDWSSPYPSNFIKVSLCICSPDPREHFTWRILHSSSLRSVHFILLLLLVLIYQRLFSFGRLSMVPDRWQFLHNEKRDDRLPAEYGYQNTFCFHVFSTRSASISSTRFSSCYSISELEAFRMMSHSFAIRSRVSNFICSTENNRECGNILWAGEKDWYFNYL